jgi:hypothetical protein
VIEMDKWEELKSWTTHGVGSLGVLIDNATNESEIKRLEIRKKEFQQFLQKMNEIEKVCEGQYKCPECKTITNSTEWDKTTEIVFGDSISIDSEEREDCEYMCPKCRKQVDGFNITKIL